MQPLPAVYSEYHIRVTREAILPINSVSVPNSQFHLVSFLATSTATTRLSPAGRGNLQDPYLSVNAAGGTVIKNAHLNITNFN